MSRSRNIADYFSISLLELKVDQTIPFDLFLYFASANHILLWKRKGEPIEKDWLNLYLSRGLKRIWILSQDRDSYERYLGHALSADTATNPVSLEQPATPKLTSPDTDQETIADEEQAETPTLPSAEAQETPSPQEANAPQAQSTEQVPEEIAHTSVLKALTSPDLPIEEKKKAARETARAWFKSLENKSMQAKTPESVNQDLETQNPSDFTKEVQDLLEEIAKRNDLIRDILDSSVEWGVTSGGHSKSVLSYTLLFALANERTDMEELTQLALAALLHDIGQCWTPARISRSTWSQLSEADKLLAGKHVERGIGFLKTYCDELDDSAIHLIRMHHEKFDGTGYPAGIKGFALDDLSQLLSMAELASQVQSGAWDGKQRTLKESLEWMGGLEGNHHFPQFFNPEILTKISKVRA